VTPKGGLEWHVPVPRSAAHPGSRHAEAESSWPTSNGSSGGRTRCWVVTRRRARSGSRVAARQRVGGGGPLSRGAFRRGAALLVANGGGCVGGPRGAFVPLPPGYRATAELAGAPRPGEPADTDDFVPPPWHALEWSQPEPSTAPALRLPAGGVLDHSVAEVQDGGALALRVSACRPSAAVALANSYASVYAIALQLRGAGRAQVRFARKAERCRRQALRGAALGAA
jgi:hypothetical protein